MSRIAIKTEKLDVEQEEIGIESRTAEEEGGGDSGGFGSNQEHRKGVSPTDVSNLTIRTGKQTLEVGRKSNMAMRQQLQQQNPPQPTALLKGSSGSGGAVSGSVSGGGGVGGNADNNSGFINSSSHEIIRTKKSTLPKSRCGEVFVSNNARQWTFICTYCNKSTRDIGEFICHIKMKHLGGFADGGDETDDADFDGNQQSHFYEQDQDYMDCGNYLDVNVHTESEDYSVNGHDHSATYRNMGSNNHQQTPRPPLMTTAAAAAAAAASKKSEAKRKMNLQNKTERLNSVEDEPIDTENADHGTFGRGTPTTKESAAQWRADPANFQSYSNKYNFNASTPDIKLKNNKTENGNTAEFDASDYAIGAFKDDYDTTSGGGGGIGFGAEDNDDEDDYDNQLLIAPNDSMDASLWGGIGAAAADVSGGLGGGEMKTKRRQIRGTAYCALCNKTFQYYSLYRNHMIKHSNETPFKCPICKKGFKSKQAIRYHMNTHQKEKQYKCTVCSASYGTENHFISHIMSHENSTTFPCMVCGQVMSSSKERDLHMAEHKEERPFRCDYCFKLFRLRHHLSNHLKMHRKYRCDYCKEIFTSAIYLRKPYACPGCENSPDARQDAANSASNSNNSKRGGGDADADGNSVNPLEIFETVIPGQQQGDDYAQMVTDSEGEGENEEDEEEDDDDEDEDDDDDDNDENAVGGAREAERDTDAAAVDDDSNSILQQRVAKRPHKDVDNDAEDDDEDEEGYDDSAAGGSGQFQNDYDDGIKRFECKYCHRKYANQSGLSYHIRAKHC